MRAKQREESDRSAEAALYAARAEVIREMPEIISKIIEQAKKGSYQHAKFLLDFAGSEQGAATVTKDEESLAAMLLKELKDGTASDAA